MQAAKLWLPPRQLLTPRLWPLLACCSKYRVVYSGVDDSCRRMLAAAAWCVAESVLMAVCVMVCRLSSFRGVPFRTPASVSSTTEHPSSAAVVM